MASRTSRYFCRRERSLEFGSSVPLAALPETVRALGGALPPGPLSSTGLARVDLTPTCCRRTRRSAVADVHLDSSSARSQPPASEGLARRRVGRGAGECRSDGGFADASERTSTPSTALTANQLSEASRSPRSTWPRSAAVSGFGSSRIPGTWA
jgi:hypothetical protein